VPALSDPHNCALRTREANARSEKRGVQDPFIVELIDGDGCFSVSFLAKKRILLGFHITGALTKSQFRLFFRIKRRFGQCGSITRKRVGSASSYCRYQVDSFRDIKKHIIPFMDQHTLYTEKAIHYAKFRKVVDLIKKGAHLNRLGFFRNCGDSL
jgi:LAGLIDADG endonuclease